MNLRTHPEILEIEKKFQDRGVPFDLAYRQALSKIPQKVQFASSPALTNMVLEILKRELMKYLIEHAPTIIESIFSWLKKRFSKSNAEQQDNG